MVTDWTIQPRTGVTLSPDYDPVRFWSSLMVVERHNVTGQAQGTWTVTALNEGLAGLLTPGNGVLLYRNGEQIMSGPVTSIQRGARVSTIGGVSDTSCLADRVLFPVPSQPITNQGAQAYDNRSGPAEDVLLAYVNVNAGPAAIPSRRIPLLRIPASLGRGGNVTITGRLDKVSDLVSDLAESGNLHVDVVQLADGLTPYLTVRVRAVVDRSADVRFGTLADATGGTLGADWAYTLSRPTVTDALVAGGGEGTDRVFREAVDSDAEALWGGKREVLVDQRQTTDTDELDQAGTDAVSDGAEPVSVSFTIQDSFDVRYRRDWQVGDRVGVAVDGIDATNLVREVTTTVARGSNTLTEQIKAVVGSRDSSNWTTKDNKDIARALRAVDRLKAI